MSESLDAADLCWPVQLGSFYYEPRASLGQDAPPIAETLDLGGWLLACCDGVGGRGAGTYLLDGEQWSGARLGSRAVADTLRDIFMSPPVSNVLEPPLNAVRCTGGSPLEALTSAFEKSITLSLDQLSARTERQGVALSSSDDFPSTLVSVVGSVHDRMGSTVTWERVVWAGDSRVYVLTPEAGLHQVTVDDLRITEDALDNLTYDSPMSNYIRGNRSWFLHGTQFTMSTPHVTFACSDGCFGYVRAPWDFEALLLEAISTASTVLECCEVLRASIKQITGDDSTFAACFVGWSSYDEARASYSARAQMLAREYTDVVAKAQANASPEQAKAQLQAIRRSLWARYRRNYYAMHPHLADVSGESAIEEDEK